MSDLGLLCGGVLLAVIVAGDLRFSPAYMRSVRAAVAAGDPGARMRMYRLTIALSWIAAAAALAAMVAGGLSAAEIGLRLPDLGALGDATPLLAGAAAGLVVGAVAAGVAAHRGTGAPVVGDVDVILPRGGAQRRWFAGVALTAGITEEVVYRALALAVLLAVLPGEQRWPAVGLAAVLFGLAHVYQGIAGVVATGLMAVVFGLTYLETGSLLPGMVLHALIDLRALALRTAPDPVAGA